MGTTLTLSIDRYEANRAREDRTEDSWLVLSAVFGSGVDVHSVGGISLTVADVRELVSWMRSVARGRITSASPLGRRPLLSFPEPDVAVRVGEPTPAGVTTSWLFRDPSSLEDYSSVLMNFEHARMVELTTTRVQLKSAADELLRELSNLSDR